MQLLGIKTLFYDNSAKAIVLIKWRDRIRKFATYMIILLTAIFEIRIITSILL